MKKLIQEGIYTLVETKRKTRVLSLDNKDKFAWITVRRIGEMLVSIQSKFQTNTIISSGRYRIFDIRDEPDLTDLEHLELEAGNDIWQGYLLPTGLPTKSDKRRRIISTNELIGLDKEKAQAYDTFMEKFKIITPPLM